MRKLINYTHDSIQLLLVEIYNLLWLFRVDQYDKKLIWNRCFNSDVIKYLEFEFNKFKKVLSTA